MNPLSRETSITADSFYAVGTCNPVRVGDSPVLSKLIGIEAGVLRDYLLGTFYVADIPVPVGCYRLHEEKVQVGDFVAISGGDTFVRVSDQNAAIGKPAKNFSKHTYIRRKPCKYNPEYYKLVTHGETIERGDILCDLEDPTTLIFTSISIGSTVDYLLDGTSCFLRPTKLREAHLAGYHLRHTDMGDAVLAELWAVSK